MWCFRSLHFKLSALHDIVPLRDPYFSQPFLWVKNAVSFINIIFFLLTANVMETLRGDGNVLIAVDTAGRVLELAQLLDQIWRTKDAGLGVYPLALLNNVSYNVVEFSKSQVSITDFHMLEDFVLYLPYNLP